MLIHVLRSVYINPEFLVAVKRRSVIHRKKECWDYEFLLHHDDSILISVVVDSPEHNKVANFIDRLTHPQETHHANGGTTP